MSTRRKFLTLSATLATGALLPRSAFAERLGGPVFSNASTGAYQQGLMTPATFQKLIGTEFKAFLENYGVAWLSLREVITLELKSPEEQAAARKAAGKVVAPAGADLSLGRNPIQPVSFQLRFDIRGSAFPEDNYLLDHATLGRFVLALKPGEPGRCSAYLSSFAAEGPKKPVLRSTRLALDL